MTSLQPRKPAGTPVGGEFDHKQGSAPTSALARVDHKAAWAELFEATDRAQLTRKGITSDEWLDAGLAAGQYGSDLLIEAHRNGLSPEQTRALLRVVHHKSGAFYGAGEKDFDPEMLDRIPDELCPMYLNEIELLPDDPAVLEAWALAARHDASSGGSKLMTGLPRLAKIGRIVDAGVDESYDELTGSGGNWWRAALVRESGLDPALAARWPMFYPDAIPAIEAGGWQPEEITGDGPLSAYEVSEWARSGADAVTHRKWAAIGQGLYRSALPYMSKGVTPEQAAPWQQFGIGYSTPAFAVSGLTVDQVAAARDAGLVLDHDAIEVIREVPPREIVAWAQLLGSEGSVGSKAVIPWRSVGLLTPAEAEPWVAHLRAENLRTTSVPALKYALDAGVKVSDLPAGGHPVPYAVAKATGADLGKLLAAADPLEASRTALRRRKLPVPF